MKIFLIATLFILVISLATGLAAICNGEYFWLRCIMLYPFTYAAVKIAIIINTHYKTYPQNDQT